MKKHRTKFKVKNNCNGNGQGCRVIYNLPNDGNMIKVGDDGKLKVMHIYSLN